MQRTKLLLPLVAILFAIASSASAQRGGTGGGGGGMSGFSGGMSGMSGGMSGMSGMSGGMGGMGGGFSSGMGGMGGGLSSGMGGGFGSSALGGTGMGQSGMGMNQQGNQGFVGRDSADMTSVFNQLGRNSNQFFQQMNRNMSRGNRNTSQEENAALAVRVRLDVAFDRPQVQPAAVGTAVRGRLDKLLTHRKITAPNVEVVGDTVVLSGVAASESQRLVIEKLVSLEPGVMTVENQMTVAGEPPLNPPVPPQSDN